MAFIVTLPDLMAAESERLKPWLARRCQVYFATVAIGIGGELGTDKSKFQTLLLGIMKSWKVIEPNEIHWLT